MAGRAGRKAQENKNPGESYVFCKSPEKDRVSELISKRVPDIESCMAGNKCGLTRALLEAISCGLVKTVFDVERLVCDSLVNCFMFFFSTYKRALYCH